MTSIKKCSISIKLYLIQWYTSMLWCFTIIDKVVTWKYYIIHCLQVFTISYNHSWWQQIYICKKEKYQPIDNFYLPSFKYEHCMIYPFWIYITATHFPIAFFFSFSVSKLEFLKTKKASVWETYNTLVGKQDSNKRMHEAGSAPNDGDWLLPLFPLQTALSLI